MSSQIYELQFGTHKKIPHEEMISNADIEIVDNSDFTIFIYEDGIWIDLHDKTVHLYVFICIIPYDISSRIILKKVFSA